MIIMSSVFPRFPASRNRYPNRKRKAWSSLSLSCRLYAGSAGSTGSAALRAKTTGREKIAFLADPGNTIDRRAVQQDKVPTSLQPRLPPALANAHAPSPAEGANFPSGRKAHYTINLMTIK